MSALDRYEGEGVDDEATDEVDFMQAQAARLRAERDMDRRDVREGRYTGRRARLPGALEGAPADKAEPCTVVVASVPTNNHCILCTGQRAADGQCDGPGLGRQLARLHHEQCFGFL